MFDDLRMFARYAWRLNSYLRQILTPQQCHQMLVNHLERRDESFLRILERGVYANPRSPYYQLLKHARVEFPDVVGVVKQHGIEGALTQLYEAGVYVTLDEFKGRCPIQRSGLQFVVRPQDFDNPLLAKHYEARSGGSRGAGTRVIIDLDLLTHEAAYLYQFLEAFDLSKRPTGIWFQVPPTNVGMKQALRNAKLGKPVEKWFSQSKLSLSPRTWKFFLFTNYTVYSSKILGKSIPVPEHVPLEEAFKVAIWIATKREEGTPAVLHTHASSGVRVCLIAKEKGLDISGTFFRLGGEPYTPAKAQVLAESGSRAGCHYSMAEIGNIGIGCANPKDLDDVHLLTDKIALIQRTKPVGNSGLNVGALVYTTLLPSCPRLMLNVESDDYGVLENRACGCPIGELGFTRHLSQIRSYEKLTSEGMTFLGTELLRLLEEVLPTRFGGHSTDYQFVEEEEGGLPKVSIVVSPRVGSVSEEALVETVFQELRAVPGGEMMSDHWRQGKTLRVVRREPYSTSSAKILPLHILQKK
ncbi:MAG: hypothetical protein ACREOW_00480 [Thermodesulfobacteriota bacterium]